MIIILFLIINCRLTAGALFTLTNAYFISFANSLATDSASTMVIEFEIVLMFE